MHNAHDKNECVVNVTVVINFVQSERNFFVVLKLEMDKQFRKIILQINVSILAKSLFFLAHLSRQAHKVSL